MQIPRSVNALRLDILYATKTIVASFVRRLSRAMRPPEGAMIWPIKIELNRRYLTHASVRDRGIRGRRTIL